MGWYHIMSYIHFFLLLFLQTMVINDIQSCLIGFEQKKKKNEEGER